MKIEELMEPQTPSPATGAKINLMEEKEDSPDEKSVVPFQSGDEQSIPIPIAPSEVEKSIRLFLKYKSSLGKNKIYNNDRDNI